MRCWIGGITLAAASLVACTHTNVARLDPTISFRATCEQGIVMYLTPEKAPSDYKELALLNSSGNTGLTSHGGMLKSQRKKAASVGATGIILGGIKEPNAAMVVAGAILGVGAERTGKALAIYAPSDTAKVYEACAAVGRG